MENDNNVQLIPDSRERRKKPFKNNILNESKQFYKMSSENVTSLSKRNASINWLTFVGDNGLNNVLKNANDTIRKRNKNYRNSLKKPPEVTKVLAMDCEMVSDLNNKNMLARISVVNFKLECIYDKYVKPTAAVGDFRTRISGIREEDLINGDDFEIVRREVKQLLSNKILVGHALHNDFKVLKFGHHKKLIRDTSRYKPFRESNDMKSPALKYLAKVFLGENIQIGEHSSIEDAITAMKLYKKFRKEWEI